MYYESLSLNIGSLDDRSFWHLSDPRADRDVVRDILNLIRLSWEVICLDSFLDFMSGISLYFRTWDVDYDWIDFILQSFTCSFELWVIKVSVLICSGVFLKYEMVITYRSCNVRLTSSGKKKGLTSHCPWENLQSYHESKISVFLDSIATFFFSLNPFSLSFLILSYLKLSECHLDVLPFYNHLRRYSCSDDFFNWR